MLPQAIGDRRAIYCLQKLSFKKIILITYLISIKMFSVKEKKFVPLHLVRHLY